MTNTIEVPFDIENVEVIGTQINEAGQFIITVKSTIESACCHSCVRLATELYGHSDARLVKLNEIFFLSDIYSLLPQKIRMSPLR